MTNGSGVWLSISIWLATAVAAPAQQPWSGFEAILWVDRAGQRSDAFWAGLADRGYTAVSVSRAGDADLPARHGLRFYVDQAAGKGVLELRDAQWEPTLRRFLETRDEAALRRPVSLADPAVLDGLRAAVAEALGRARVAGPIAASLADEASATRRANPLDICLSEPFRAAFRARMVELAGAGGVAALNARWGTGYGSFEQVEPWTTDRIRERELAGPALPRNLAPWGDQLDLADRLFAAAVLAATTAAEQAAPGIPTGLTGMQPPTAFGGHDYWRLMPSMAFYEVYDLGGARDLAEAWARPGAREVATLFPAAEGQPPALVDARLGAMVARGMSGVVVWNAGEVVDDSNATTVYGRRVERALGRLRPAAIAFAGARIERAPVWIVESRASVRAHWMLDSWDDGATWPRRFSSWEVAHGTSLVARASWVALLRDLGLQPDFVDDRDLPERLRERPPRVLILPACLAVSDAAAAAIAHFVEAGGHAVADHGLGLYDDVLRLRSRGVLDRLFGLEGRSRVRADHLVRNARGSDRMRMPSGVAVAEAGVRGTLGERVGDELAMVQIEARVGRGRTTFLNVAVCEYASVRLSPERVATARALRRRVQRTLDAAGVRPPLLVEGRGLPTCVERIPLRAADGRRLLAVRVDALDAPQLLQLLDDGGPRQVELTFPGPVRLRDVLRGVELEPDDADARVFHAALAAFEPLFLEVGVR